MSLKPYTVDIDGIEHTLLLSDADAERRGLRPSTEGDNLEIIIAEKVEAALSELETEHAKQIDELETEHAKQIDELKTAHDTVTTEAVAEALAAAETTGAKGKESAGTAKPAAGKK